MIDIGGTYCGLLVANVVSRRSIIIPYLDNLGRNFQLTLLEEALRNFNVIRNAVIEPTIYGILLYPLKDFNVQTLNMTVIMDMLNKFAYDHDV